MKIEIPDECVSQIVALLNKGHDDKSKLDAFHAVKFCVLFAVLCEEQNPGVIGAALAPSILPLYKQKWN